MSLYVLDTDTVSLYHAYDPVVERYVNARPSGEVAISVITVEEQLSGWYTFVRKATTATPRNRRTADSSAEECQSASAGRKLREFSSPHPLARTCPTA